MTSFELKIFCIAFSFLTILFLVKGIWHIKRKEKLSAFLYITVSVVYLVLMYFVVIKNSPS